MAETNRMTADDRNDEKARNLLLAINGQEGSGEQAGDRTALSGEQSGESGRASASGEDGSGETIVEHYAENEREYRDDNVKDTTDTNEYTADDIQILEGLEAVRKRPGMYIGTTSSRGLHHLVYEIVDNSVDEALAGYCTHIEVTINPGNSVTVADDGRGIPVGINHKMGKSALEVVFTILHAGGKFGGGGYKVSGGLHGVGASVVNALSERLEVQVRQDGGVYEMKFSRGKITEPMKRIGSCPAGESGTTVTFQPDPEIFQETLEYDYDTLRTRLRETAFLTRNLRITLRDTASLSGI